MMRNPESNEKRMTKSGARNRVRRGKPSFGSSTSNESNLAKCTEEILRAVLGGDLGRLRPSRASGRAQRSAPPGAPSCSALQPRNCSCRPLCLQRSATCLRPELAARAEAAFLRLSAAGELVPVDLNPADSERMAELVEQYADFPLRETAASSSQLWIATSRRGRAGAATGMLGVRVPLAPPLVSDGLPLLGWGTFRPVQQKVQQR
jgi:hypothetical protein